jgi:hypothetical protein
MTKDDVKDDTELGHLWSAKRKVIVRNIKTNVLSIKSLSEEED